MFAFLLLAQYQQISHETDVDNLDANFGIVCESENVIYVSNLNDDFGLYEMDKTPGRFEKIDGIYAGGMNLYKDWLYYIETTDNSIKRMDTNSHQSETLVENSEPTILLQVYKKSLYYQSGANLYRADLDGQNKTQIVSDVKNFYFVYDDVIYYNQTNGGDKQSWKLFFTKTDGATSEMLCDEGALSVCVINDKIYFTTKEADLFTVKPGKNDAQKLDTDIVCVNGDKEQIYFFSLKRPIPMKSIPTFTRHICFE